LDQKKTADFSRFRELGLIKSVDAPIQNLSAEQKAALNRKGNQFYNEGEIEAARRIFVTTGYSDGLTRIGDHYLSKGREIDALKMFWLAHNKRKAEPLIGKIAQVIESLIKT